MGRYVLGIDQGTTGTFVCLMDESGQAISTGYKTHQQIYPQANWVEQDPEELWRNACVLINQVIVEAKIRAEEIAGIGIANQGESLVMWDRQTGKALYNVLVWQDTRTQEYTEQLACDIEIAKEVTRRTGLKLDSYFSASKMRWLLDHVTEADLLLKEARLACGTLDSWLIWKMTDGQAFVTDVSTASRTLLFNIHTLQWDPWLLDLFQIPTDILPRVLESTAAFGTVAHAELACRGAQIVASVVDQPAAMIGQGCLRAGQIKATYGTGCFINLNTGTLPVTSQQGLLTFLAWQREGTPAYGLEGGVFTAASTVNWLEDSLKLIPGADAIDALCLDVRDSGGVVWIPAQIGLGAPYWERSIRGAWLGLELSSSRAHLVRAVLEGIAAHVARIVQTMQDEGGPTAAISSLRADGGLTGSKTILQIQADMLGLPVEVVANAQATASGICGLAARASGMWKSDALLMERVKIAQTYEPSISEDERQNYMGRFDRAIRHMKAWHANE